MSKAQAYTFEITILDWENRKDQNMEFEDDIRQELFRLSLPDEHFDTSDVIHVSTKDFEC